VGADRESADRASDEHGYEEPECPPHGRVIPEQVQPGREGGRAELDDKEQQ
jgi:hypothetical protein